MPVSQIQSASLASGVPSSANMPAGSVLQVVSAAKTDTFSTNSTSMIDVTGLSLSITPKFATSKILVMYQCNTGVDATVQGIFIQLVRNSTSIFIGDAASSRPRVTANNALTNIYGVLELSGSYLDSPSSTSSTTYKVQMMVNGGGSNFGYINRSVADRDTSLYDCRASSSITVMEIAG